MQISIFHTELPPAKNQLCSVLKMLIEKESVSERDTVFNGFRSRIADLRNKHQLGIRHNEEKFKNQFGRVSSFRRHYLLTIEKDKAIDLYKALNK